MTNHEARVNGEIAFETIKPGTKSVPHEIESSFEGLNGHAFDASQHRDQVFGSFGSYRRNGETTIATKNRCHAMQRRRSGRWVPHHLGVIVSMEINKSRGYDATLGIDGFSCGLGDVTNRNDATIANADIGAETVSAGSIDNSATLDQKIEHENSP
ncbi:unannotated protein [freshwater metagenome]|uniref:Unannotated protein n=1 Tax=freshwater metagenome TaxID=449393 RepID=A0A6J7N4W5_9ZZZZ